MIPSQFGFSAPPAYADVQSQSNDFDGSAHNDSKHSHHRSTSFSHILSALSKSSDVSAQPRSGQTSKQTEDDGQTGDGSTAGIGVQAAVQQAPLTIEGLLALLNQQPVPIKDGSQKDGAPAQTENSGAQLNSPEKATSQNNTTTTDMVQANLGGRAGSLRALATSVLPTLGAAKGEGKRTDEKTSSRQDAVRGAAGSLAIPIELQQASGEALASSAGFETANGGAPGSANGNPAEQTGNAQSATAASGAAASAPLAFTMLLSTDGPNAGNTSAMASGSAEPAATAMTQIQHAVSGLVNAAATEAAPSLTSAHELNAETNAGPAALAETGGSRNSDDRAPAAEQPRASTASDADANANADSSPSELVRNVRVQLQAGDNQRVDVRLVDQGGELRVSVRSGDASLTQALQDHMPELTNRLEQQHVRAEVWIPRPAETSSARNFSSQEGGSSGQGNSGQRQNGRQNNRPDWLEEDIPSQNRR